MRCITNNCTFGVCCVWQDINLVFVLMVHKEILRTNTGQPDCYA